MRDQILEAIGDWLTPRVQGFIAGCYVTVGLAFVWSWFQ